MGLFLCLTTDWLGYTGNDSAVICLKGFLRDSLLVSILWYFSFNTSTRDLSFYMDNSAFHITARMVEGVASQVVQKVKEVKRFTGCLDYVPWVLLIIPQC